jgi:predicted GTPase
MRRIIIMGAGGRDFHNFNVAFRLDPDTHVVCFTAAQIPGIDDRRYPATLAGPGYPDGIAIHPEADLADLIHTHKVDEVVLAYSDLAHRHVMHQASRVLAAGADFRLLGPETTMLASRLPVVAVCATRTGAGKSQTSRKVGRLLQEAGFRVALVRHPMPYGDLERMRVQRFASLADIDACQPTIEEREEYEEPVRQGLTVFAGVDYADVLHAAEADADVIVWDGGNNDVPFYRPDLWITVADPLRAGDEVDSHPGEVNLRRAHVVVVNKIDSASLEQVATVVGNVSTVNPGAIIVKAMSPVELSEGPALAGRRVLVIEDGPTITHGGLPFGAGAVAARHHGATTLVDTRPVAVGSIAETLAAFPHITEVLPAVGYGADQLADLAATSAAAAPDVVVTGTPIDLRHVIDVAVPVRHAGYAIAEIGHPDLADVLRPYLPLWRKALTP